MFIMANDESLPTFGVLWQLVQVPVINSAACFTPLLALGSLGLIVVGFRRVLDP